MHMSNYYYSLPLFLITIPFEGFGIDQENALVSVEKNEIFIEGQCFPVQTLLLPMQIEI